MSRLLLISRSRKFETRLRSLLDYDFDTITGTSLSRGASSVLSGLSAGDGPDVALLGPALSHAQTYELSAGISALYPKAGIMLVRERGRGMEKWISDMKVDAVASPNLDDTSLVAAVQRLGSAHGHPADDRTRPQLKALPTREPEPESLSGQPETLPVSSEETLGRPSLTSGRVIAVVSPKGGMGKTTVATNLAVGLAKIAPMDVVLIDGDAQFGDIATALSLDPTYTLPDAVSEGAAHDTMVLKTYLTDHPSGFYTVCGALSPVDGDRVTGEQLGGLIAQLRSEFRFVVVDTAPGLGDHTLAAIEQATDLVLVCGMSVTSARGLRNHLAAIASAGMMPANTHVVLNFADHDSGMSVRDVEETTGVSVDIAIPRSKLVVLSTNLGIPILESPAKNSASRAFAGLVLRFDAAADHKNKQPRRHRRVVVK
jgi:MinD-like ATPase involved in chromosome partitioning or flagellar assembly